MLTLTIITLGVLLLAGGAALLHAVQHAPEGYEDAQGFHSGILNDLRFSGSAVQRFKG
jgi:hypothetical protein